MSLGGHLVDTGLVETGLQHLVVIDHVILGLGRKVYLQQAWLL